MSTINITPIATNNPIDLKASNVIKGIALDWTDFGDTKSTLIYRSNTNNRANAVIITDTLANSYVDTNISYNQPYYYWIKFINQWDRSDGSFYPLNALSGVSITPSQVLTVDLAENAVNDFAFVNDYSIRPNPEISKTSNEWYFYNEIQSLQFETDSNTKFISVSGGLSTITYSLTHPSSGYYQHILTLNIFDAANARLQTGLTETWYNNGPSRPAYHGGNGYVIGDIITLNCGANVLVDNVNASGNVTAFNIQTSSNVDWVYHDPEYRIQEYTTGSGTGFRLFWIGSGETLGDFDFDHEWDSSSAWFIDNKYSQLEDSYACGPIYVIGNIGSRKFNLGLSHTIEKQGTSNGSMTANITGSFLQIQQVKR